MMNKKIMFGLGLFLILLTGLSPWAAQEESSSEVFQAARAGDLARIKALLSRDPALLNAKNENLKTTLQFAVEGGSVEVVKFLIEKGADVKEKNIAGETALHYASGYSRIELINLLIDEGADVNAKSDAGNTPLHYIRFMGVPEAAEALLSRGADINARNDEGQSLLTIAFQLKRPRLIRTLMGKGAEIDSTGGEGPEMLLHAVEMEEMELMDILFSKGIKIKAQSPVGSRILHAAAGMGNQDLVMELLADGADFRSKNSLDGNLLHSASQGGLLKVVENLVKKGIDANLRDRLGRNPLDIARDWGYAEIAEFFLSNGIADSGRPEIIIESGSRTGKREEPAELDVVYIANDGFMLSSGGKTVLLDAVFRNPFGYLDTPLPVYNKILASKLPFEKIDLMFYSHAHRDHFDPEMAVQVLKSHPETVLVGNGVLEEELKAAAGSDFQRLKERIQIFDPEWGTLVNFKSNNIDFGVFPVNHAEPGQEYVTLAFYIDMNGIGVLHVGDLVPVSNVENFKPIGLENREIDIAFIDPFFLQSGEGRQILNDHIRPEWIIPMHLRPDEVDRYHKELGESYPNIKIFHVSMEKKIFKKQP